MSILKFYVRSVCLCVCGWQHEEKSLQILSAHLPQKLPDTAKFSDPHTKALVLLQCHFSRQPLPLVPSYPPPRLPPLPVASP